MYDELNVIQRSNSFNESKIFSEEPYLMFLNGNGLKSN